MHRSDRRRKSRCGCAGLTRETVRQEAAEAVIVATGALPAYPAFPGDNDPAILHGWTLLGRLEPLGKTILIADSTLDWTGIGLAEMLARSGREVRLCAIGFGAGDNLPGTTKGHAPGVLHGLGVRIEPLMQPGGYQGRTAYFEHATSIIAPGLPGRRCGQLPPSAYRHDVDAEIDRDLRGPGG